MSQPAQTDPTPESASFSQADVDAATTQAVTDRDAAESNRMEQIRNLGKQHGALEEALDAIAEGKTIEQFNSDLVGILSARLAEQPGQPVNVSTTTTPVLSSVPKTEETPESPKTKEEELESLGVELKQCKDPKEKFRISTRMQNLRKEINAA